MREGGKWEDQSAREGRVGEVGRQGASNRRIPIISPVDPLATHSRIFLHLACEKLPVIKLCHDVSRYASSALLPL